MTIPIASDFDKISPTALGAAYSRQFTDIPYSKEIAELTNAEAFIKQYAGELKLQAVTNSQPLVMTASLEARYKTIEQVMTQFNGTQILELASGLLPRGTIWSQNPEIVFIESDLPGIIHQKQQVIQQLVGSRPNLHFLAIDATQRPNPLMLTNYFHPEKPVTILCEGLLMYLTFAEKQQVFANVREILQTYGGVWITSDFITQEARKLRENDPALRQVDQKIASLTGRSFMHNEFEDLQHVKQFAQEQGFQVQEFSLLKVFDQLKCLSVLGIDPELAKAILATVPVCALTIA